MSGLQTKKVFGFRIKNLDNLGSSEQFSKLHDY